MHQRTSQQQGLAHRMADTERACQTVWLYLSDLARQLNVIEPDGPTFTLDNRQMWPQMKLMNFRADVRRRQLHHREVVDYIALGWSIVPRQGRPLAASVSVNFPPDLERVQSRLACGHIAHERHEVRHPEKNSLLAFRFDYTTEAMGSVRVTPDHASGELAFRLANLRGFEVVTVAYPADRIGAPLLDELARLVVGQSGKFI